jgi:hypothetical protein
MRRRDDLWRAALLLTVELAVIGFAFWATWRWG